MKVLTMADIQNKNPCYSPLKYAGENWTGTILNVLRDPRIPAKDKIWVATRQNILSDKTARLFEVWCAREAIKVSGWSDPRSLKAIEVAKAFAHGKATRKELIAAADAARAAYAAADAAARKAQVKQLIKLVMEHEQ